MTFKAPTGAGQHTYSDIYANALWEMLRVGGSKKPMEDLLTRALRGYGWIEQAVPSPYRGTVIQGLPKALSKYDHTTDYTPNNLPPDYPEKMTFAEYSGCPPMDIDYMRL